MSEWVVRAEILSWEFYTLANVGDKRVLIVMAGRDLQCPRQLPTTEKNLLHYVGRAAVEGPGLKPRVGEGCWEGRRERRQKPSQWRLAYCGVLGVPEWSLVPQPSAGACGEELSLMCRLWVADNLPSLLATPGGGLV